MRKHRHHHQKSRPKGARLVALVVGIIVLYAGILLTVHLVGNHLEHPDEVKETVGSLEGRFTSDTLTLSYGGSKWTYRERELTHILLMGVDWEEISQSNSSQRYNGQADFLLLLTIDQKNKTVSTLQIDRDTIADVRIYGIFGNYAGTRRQQICLAHAYGETEKECCENVVWAVSNLLGGIPIDSYVSLDMESIAILNDALGGITVTLEDDFSHLDAAMTQGTTLTLHGKQAEYYVRGRMGIGAGSNASRMQRQRVFMQAVGDLFVTGMSQSMEFAASLFDQLSDHMVTNIDRGWFIDKAYASSAYQRLENRTLAGSHQIGSDGFVEFWADEDALGSYLTDTFFIKNSK